MLWNRTLSNLRSLNSDYINNSYDALIQGNLTISGTLQSPTTNLLSVSTNLLNTKVETYNLNQTNLNSALTISAAITNNKLELYETLNINNFNLLGTTTLNLDLNQSNQTYLQGIQNQLLQNQIDSLVLIGVSGQITDTQFAISGSIWDSKLGLILGVSIPSLDNRIINLTTTGLNNFNSLSATGILNNQEFQSNKLLTNSYINTLNNLGSSHANRLNTLDLQVYNLNVSSNLHGIRLNNIDLELINQDSRLTNVEDFLSGTTMSLSTTGVNWTETTANTLQDVITYTQYGIDGVNVALWSRDFYHSTQELGLLGAINAEIAARQGYEVLNDAENASQDVAIASNSAGLISAGVLISANTAANVANSVLINGVSGLVASNTNDITNLGVSVNNNLDHKINSFILGTTTHLNSIDSSLTNLGTTNNGLSTRITNFEDRITINTLGMTFKGQTINIANFTDIGLNISGALNVSGTLQSPLTSLLSVSSNIIDGKVGKIIGVSIPQFLTRNETTIPVSFSNYILNDNLIFNSQANTNSYIQFQNNQSGSNSFYIGKVGSSSMVLNTTGTMIFAKNGTENSRIDASGNWIMNNNLTVSGTLQSPLTSLLSVSSGIIDGRVGTIIGVSTPQFLTRNETTLPSSFTSSSLTSLGTLTGNLTISGTLQSPLTSLLSVSSNIIDGKISSQIGITNINFDNKIILLGTTTNNIISTINSLNNNTLGTSIGNHTTTLNNIIGVSIPQFLTRNETTLPSSFVSSSLTSVGTLTSLINSGNLTISGTLQSPLTSLLSVSSNTLDIRLNSVIGVSGSQFITRNETILPSTFRTSNLNTLGTSGFTGSGNIDTNNNYNFYVGGRESFGTKKDTKMAIVACGQDMQSTLYFGTPFAQGSDGNKVSLISQGQSNTSIGKLFFCLNNNTSNHNLNAEITDARMSLDANGLLSVSGNQVNFNNLTISGTLQSPLTSLLSVSSNTTDGKVALLSVSSNTIDGRVGTIIGVSIPQFLTRNETTLPSSFINSSLTSVGTLTSLNANSTSISNMLTISRIRTGAPSGTADFISLYSGTASNCYFGFNNNTYTGLESMVGLVGTDTQLRAPQNLLLFTNGTQRTSMDISGNWIMNNNLTISGTLQSPMTSLLSVSSNTIDGKVGTIIGVSTPQFLTRNEIVLPSSFITWGTTSANKQVNTDSNLFINATTNDSYINLRSAQGGNTLIGQLSSDIFLRMAKSTSNFKIQNSSSVDKMTMDASGNVVVSGTLTTGGLVDATGNSVLRGTDPLQLTNSGNSNFKQTGGSFTKRYEQQSGGNYYCWDEGNNEIYHISTDRQMWWQGDFNVAGTYFDSGVPLVPSSKKLKTNIRELPEDKILDKIEFKHYTKTYKNKTYEEVGIIIEELEKIEGIENYDLIHTKKDEDLKFLKYTQLFMILFKEMRDRINILENKK